jgi:uncharacterized protein YqgQ
VGLVLGKKNKRLYQAGVLDEMQWEEAQRLLAQGKIAELDQLLTQATARFIRAEP